MRSLNLKCASFPSDPPLMVERDINMDEPDTCVVAHLGIGYAALSLSVEDAVMLVDFLKELLDEVNNG